MAVEQARPRSGFPRTFWTANGMELFERAAYYGMNSVLAVYLTTSVAEGGVGASVEAVGFLQSIVYAATYVLPILGGALADRYGYRRMLLVAFSLMASGYFIAGYMSTYALVFLALLVVSVLKGFSWQYVFAASAAYTGLMLLPTLFVYTDPPRPESTKKLKDTLLGAVEVLGDARFMLMIVVYSGFWILYFQNFGSVLWYLRDFVDRAPVSAALTSFFRSAGLGWTFTFDAEHVTVINAGTIILLQVFVSRIVKTKPALPTMVTGMAIGALGFLCLASSLNPWVFVLGIAVFSIGEMTAHPKYYSFVGLVAPADRKAVYMGFAFLYGVIGSLLGSNIGSFLYGRIMKPVIGTPEAPGRARLFWLMFAVLDVVAAVGLILFAKAFGTDTAETRRRARPVMNFVYVLILVLGGVFLYYAAGNTRTIVQALIFVGLGVGGLLMNRQRENA